MNRKQVYCTVQLEGTHNWPECPYDEVDYLKVPHRHMFLIKAIKTVSHSDRDLEFIILKHRVIEFLKNKYYDIEKQLCVFGSMSCEMIGEELLEYFHLSKVEVSEDGENGAIIERII